MSEKIYQHCTSVELLASEPMSKMYSDSRPPQLVTRLWIL